MATGAAPAPPMTPPMPPPPPALSTLPEPMLVAPRKTEPRSLTWLVAAESRKRRTAVFLN